MTSKPVFNVNTLCPVISLYIYTVSTHSDLKIQLFRNRTEARTLYFQIRMKANNFLQYILKKVVLRLLSLFWSTHKIRYNESLGVPTNFSLFLTHVFRCNHFQQEVVYRFPISSMYSSITLI